MEEQLGGRVFLSQGNKAMTLVWPQHESSTLTSTPKKIRGWVRGQYTGLIHRNYFVLVSFF